MPAIITSVLYFGTLQKWLEGTDVSQADSEDDDSLERHPKVASPSLSTVDYNRYTNHIPFRGKLL